MVGAVIVYSVVPLAIDFSINVDSPFLFGSGLALGRVVGALLLIRIMSPVLLSPGVRPYIIKHLFKLTALFSLIWSFESAVFALATTFVDTAIVSILHELWPIIFIISLSRLAGSRDQHSDTGEQRYLGLGLGTTVLILFAFCSIVLVVISTYDYDRGFGADNASTLIGVGLAVASAAASAMASFTVIWGRDLKEDLDGRLDGVGELACVMVAFGLGSLSVVLVTLPIGLVLAEPRDVSSVGLAVAIGFLIMVPGSALFRGAILSTQRLQVTALCYLIPVGAVGWLGLFGRIEILRPDYLVIGGVGIVSANLLISSEVSGYLAGTTRLAFKTLIVSIWSLGVLVYARDGVVSAIDYSDAGTSEYWAALGVVTTMFTLLVTFRTNRISARIHLEEDYKVTLVRCAEDLNRAGFMSRSDLEDVVAVCSKASGDERLDRYHRAREVLMRAESRMDELERSTRDDVRQLERLLDLVVLSKHRGRDDGEFIAMSSFAAVAVTIVLISGPIARGYVAVVLELFGVLLGATVVYMLVAAFDLARERDSNIFEPDMMWWPIRVRISTGQRQSTTIEASVSTIVAFGTLVLWFVLLYLKWV